MPCNACLFLPNSTWCNRFWASLRALTVREILWHLLMCHGLSLAGDTDKRINSSVQTFRKCLLLGWRLEGRLTNLPSVSSYSSYLPSWSELENRVRHLVCKCHGDSWALHSPSLGTKHKPSDCCSPNVNIATFFQICFKFYTLTFEYEINYFILFNPLDQKLGSHRQVKWVLLSP